MALRVDDRWVWVAAGVFIVLAARGIRAAIKDTVRLTALDVPDSRALASKGKPLEDSISLETLQTLCQSPNPSIREAATSLIVSRFVTRPDASELLTKDLNSRDPEIIARCGTALKFLRDWPLPPTTETGIFNMVSQPQALIDWATSPSLHTLQSTDAVLDAPFVPSPDMGDDRRPLIPSEATPVAGWINVPRERPQSEDVAEMERRRRRREAMVLHEGAGSIEEDDIIRPRR